MRMHKKWLIVSGIIMVIVLLGLARENTYINQINQQADLLSAANKLYSGNLPFASALTGSSTQNFIKLDAPLSTNGTLTWTVGNPRGNYNYVFWRGNTGRGTTNINILDGNGALFATLNRNLLSPLNATSTDVKQLIKLPAKVVAGNYTLQIIAKRNSDQTTFTDTIPLTVATYNTTPHLGLRLGPASQAVGGVLAFDVCSNNVVYPDASTISPAKIDVNLLSATGTPVANLISGKPAVDAFTIPVGVFGGNNIVQHPHPTRAIVMSLGVSQSQPLPLGTYLLQAVATRASDKAVFTSPTVPVVLYVRQGDVTPHAVLPAIIMSLPSSNPYGCFNMMKSYGGGSHHPPGP